MAAKEAVTTLIQRLEKINRQAARSLKEGVEEMLTLHKLGLSEKISVSFATINFFHDNSFETHLFSSRQKPCFCSFKV